MREREKFLNKIKMDKERERKERSSLKKINKETEEIFLNQGENFKYYVKQW